MIRDSKFGLESSESVQYPAVKTTTRFISGRSRRLQLHLSPILMGAANSAGDVLSKLISPQSLVVAVASTKQAGKEAEMFRVISHHSIFMTFLVGLLVMFYAYIIPGFVAIH
jgi:hypothetical protein